MQATTSPTTDPISSARNIYRWYVVMICMVAYVFSYIDRQIMTLLIEPIQTDLALSDTRWRTTFPKINLVEPSPSTRPDRFLVPASPTWLAARSCRSYPSSVWSTCRSSGS